MHHINLHGPWLLTDRGNPESLAERWQFPCFIAARPESVQVPFRVGRKFHSPTGIATIQKVLLEFEFLIAPEKSFLNGSLVEWDGGLSLKVDVTLLLQRFNEIQFEFEKWNPVSAVEKLFTTSRLTITSG